MSLGVFNCVRQETLKAATNSEISLQEAFSNNTAHFPRFTWANPCARGADKVSKPGNPQVNLAAQP